MGRGGILRRNTRKIFSLTFKSLRVLSLPPQIDIHAIKIPLLLEALVLGLRKASTRGQFNKSESWTCRLLQQSTGKVSDLTYSLSGAAPKLSLHNYYSFVSFQFCCKVRRDYFGDSLHVLKIWHRESMYINGLAFNIHELKLIFWLQMESETF